MARSLPSCLPLCLSVRRVSTTKHLLLPAYQSTPPVTRGAACTMPLTPRVEEQVPEWVHGAGNGPHGVSIKGYLNLMQSKVRKQCGGGEGCIGGVGSSHGCSDPCSQPPKSATGDRDNMVHLCYLRFWFLGHPSRTQGGGNKRRTEGPKAAPVVQAM